MNNNSLSRIAKNKNTIGMLLFCLCLFVLYNLSAAASSAPASFAELAEKHGPTVVNIYSTQTIQSRNLPYNYFFDNEQLPELFRHFFDIPQTPQTPQQQLPAQKRTSLGSGVITSADGYILTNNHVVQDADEINVRLSNFEEYDAKIIGRDPKTDLALIKIEPTHPLVYAEFGDSDLLKVGDWVLAIGNPFGFDHTVTAGIVSGKGRTLGDGPYQNFIQTDASINPGNSGGPLFNMAGELMGINTAIYSRSGGNIGLGFAIPANMAKSIFTQLRLSGKVTRGMLGVMIQPVTVDMARQFNLERSIGALVSQVIADSPAEKAGIKPGDIIVKFQDNDIVQMSTLPSLVAQTAVGTEAIVTLFRDGSRQELTVTIGELPEDADPSGESTESAAKNELGITVQELTAELADSLGITEQSGLLITDVTPGSVAAEAGLKRGDLILEAGTGQGRIAVKTLNDLNKVIERAQKKNVLLLIKSGKQTRFFLLKRE